MDFRPATKASRKNTMSTSISIHKKSIIAVIALLLALLSYNLILVRSTENVEYKDTFWEDDKYYVQVESGRYGDRFFEIREEDYYRILDAKYIKKGFDIQIVFNRLTKEMDMSLYFRDDKIGDIKFKTKREGI